jgi:hypothetical protein
MEDGFNGGTSPNKYTEAGNDACTATIAELDSEALPSLQSSTMVASDAHLSKLRPSDQGLKSPADIESFIDKLLSLGEANLYHWRLTSLSRILQRKDVPEALGSALETVLYVGAGDCQ